MTELCSIDEVAAICHPKWIAHHVASDVDDGTTYGYFNFLNLIEDEQAQFLVKTIEHHHLAKRCVRFIAMLLLWHL